MADIYTRDEIEAGAGFYTDRWTVIYQRGYEDVFVTGTKDSRPGHGYHVAGGGRSPDRQDLWCDLWQK